MPLALSSRDETIPAPIDAWEAPLAEFGSSEPADGLVATGFTIGLLGLLDTN